MCTQFSGLCFAISYRVAPGQQDGCYVLSRRGLILSALFALWAEDSN